MYPSYFKLDVRWLYSITKGSPSGPAQVLFKPLPDRFVTRLPPSCNSNYFGYKYDTNREIIE
ncbi:hypothetical protein DVQ95_01955 [Yersinia enterocolitica]|nr:hypothetical protein [Yersinia enterocolitica]EKN5930933.1 hypothetical protein [Yersinia enterocolitica]